MKIRHEDFSVRINYENTFILNIILKIHHHFYILTLMLYLLVEREFRRRISLNLILFYVENAVRFVFYSTHCNEI